MEEAGGEIKVNEKVKTWTTLQASKIPTEL